MNSFIIILLGIVFLMTLGYYISSLYSVHYKTVWKNKSNIKYRVKTSSITSYAPLFGLILATIIFAFYFRNSGYSPIITGAMIIITIVVGVLIRLSIKELYFFDTYLVFKNNYIEYSEMVNLLLKRNPKTRAYEMEVTTKTDLVSCKINVEDSKKAIKDIKVILPKNIKIKEVDVKTK